MTAEHGPSLVLTLSKKANSGQFSSALLKLKIDDRWDVLEIVDSMAMLRSGLVSGSGYTATLKAFSGCMLYVVSGMDLL